MQFLSLNIFKWQYQQFLDIIKNPEKPTLVFTPNPEILVRASRDEEFLNILKTATYLTPDGNGLYVGSMMQEWISFLSACFCVLFQKNQIEEKYGELIKGSDLTEDLLEFAAKEKRHILILDNKVTTIRDEFDERKKEIQNNIKRLLEDRFPGIIVHVQYDGDISIAELAVYCRDYGISYVFSCLGMKKQEQMLVGIWEQIGTNAQILGLGVGASIDFILGLQKRAPLIFQKLGIEWVYRLIQNPRKRWRRIWTAFREFPRLIKQNADTL